MKPIAPASIHRLSGLSWPWRWRVQLPYDNAVGVEDRLFYRSATAVKRRHDSRLER